MKERTELQSRLQKAYGNAPQEYRLGMRKACGQLEEGPRVRKVSGLAVAFALLLALAGAALAAHSLGTFDFLFPGTEAPQEVQNRLQSGFAQQGGELESVRVTVRDAVTDGSSVFLAVEFQAKGSRDVLLSEFDPRAERPPQEGRHLVLWQNEAMGENLYLAGRDWKSLDEQTVLMHYVIDVGSRPGSGGPLRLVFAPGVRLLDGQGQQRDLEQAQVEVSIRAEDMAHTRRRAQTPVQVQGLGIILTQAEVTLTPLATYVRATYRVDQENLEDWMEQYGSLWFRLRDGEGRSYGLLTGGRKYSDDASWHYQETVEQVYERLKGWPQALELVPYRSDTGEEFAPISLALE